MRIRERWAIWRNIPGLVLTLAVGVLPTASAQAWPPAAMNLQETGIGNLNLVTIDCSAVYDPTSGGYYQHRVNCTHTTIRISRPTFADIERQVSKLDAGEARRALEAEFPQRCTELAMMTVNPADPSIAALPEPVRLFLQSASAACRSKNLLAYVDAAKANIRTLKAYTCKIEHYPARELAFDMQAENVWRAVTSAPDRTDVLTLWRTDAGGWNLKQVTTASPHCKGPLCPKDAITEWRSDAELKLRDCRYFERG
jgi:hypothetical protein